MRLTGKKIDPIVIMFDADSTNRFRYVIGSGNIEVRCTDNLGAVTWRHASGMDHATITKVTEAALVEVLHGNKYQRGDNGIIIVEIEKVPL